MLTIAGRSSVEQARIRIDAFPTIGNSKFENRKTKFETRNLQFENHSKKLHVREARIPILICHSERSEESLHVVSPGTAEILRFAQNDRPSLFFPSSNFRSRLSLFVIRISGFEFRFSSFDSGIFIPSIPHQVAEYSRHRGYRVSAVFLSGSPASQGAPRLPPESP